MIARLIRRYRIRRLERLIAKSDVEKLDLLGRYFVYQSVRDDLVARESARKAKLTSRRDSLARAA